MAQMRFVYYLRSLNEPDRSYVGVTSDVVARVAAHNAGRSAHTARHKPWKLVVSLEFADAATAVRFEHYMKSGSGRAFAGRHFDEASAYTRGEGGGGAPAARFNQPVSKPAASSGVVP